MWYINLNVRVVILILDKLKRNLKFRLDEHNKKKSSHQATNVVKHLYTYRDHFIDFKNPEILASAFNYRELLIKETLLLIKETHF